MIAIRIDTTDAATPVLRSVAAGIQPGRLAPIIGRSGRNATRTHLFGRDQAGNKLGGARTHYYGGAARATNFTIEGDGVLISVPQIGIRQRYYGGTIKPKAAQYLTIPVHPSAHGKRAREFGDLEVVFGAGGRPVALARKASGKRSFGEIMYLLLKSVTQRPDKAVLPSDDALGSAVAADVSKYLELLVSRSGGSTA